MALPFEQDEEDKNKASENSSDQGAKSLGTESAIISAANGPEAGTEGSQSGQYTNLQSYLKSNEDQGQGSRLAGQVNEDVNSAQSDQQKAGEGFKSNVDKNAMTADEALYSQVQQDPTKVAQDDASKAKFQQLLNAQYKGPKDLTEDSEDWNKANESTNKAQQEVEASKTEGGRQALLQKAYDRPGYTQGQQKLDQLLVANDPNARAAFEKVQQSGGGLKDNYSQLQQNLRDYANQAAQNTSQARQSSRNLIGLNEDNTINQDSGLLSATQKAVQQRTAQQMADRDAQINALKSKVDNRQLNQLSPEELSQIGVGQGDALYRQQIDNYIHPNQNWGEKTLASPEEIAKYQALSDLAGVQNTYLPGGTNVGSAYGTQGYDVDQAGFKGAITAQQQAMQNELANTWYNPFDSKNWSNSKNPSAYSYSGNLASPDILYKALQNQIDASPRDAAMRQAQIDDIKNKIAQIRNKYGTNDVGNAGSYSGYSEPARRVINVRS